MSFLKAKLFLTILLITLLIQSTSANYLSCVKEAYSTISFLKEFGLQMTKMEFSSLPLSMKTLAAHFHQLKVDCGKGVDMSFSFENLDFGKCKTAATEYAQEMGHLLDPESGFFSNVKALYKSFDFFKNGFQACGITAIADPQKNNDEHDDEL